MNLERLQELKRKWVALYGPLPSNDRCDCCVHGYRYADLESEAVTCERCEELT